MAPVQPDGFRDRLRLTGYAAEQVLWFPVLLIGFLMTVIGGALSPIVIGLPVFEAGMLLNRAIAQRQPEG